MKYELSEREKGIIIGIIINVRNDYLKKNKFNKFQYITLEDKNLYDTNYMVDDILERKCNRIVSDAELGNLFESAILKTIIEEALTEKQRSVLFLYYCQKKKDREIGEILNMKEDTIRKMRDRILTKIRKRIGE